MSLLEKWRDYQFHKNLAKVDERMLKLQWKEDGLAEGRAEADAKWQTVLAAKDAEIALLREQLAKEK
jgi:hypothetical protein